LNLDNLPPIPSVWPPNNNEPPRHVYAIESYRFEGEVTKTFLKPITSYLSVAKSRGWQRILLASEVTGNPKHITQIWQTPYPYPGAIDTGTSAPEASELAALRKYREFFECVAHFERTLFVPLPYDPGPEGRSILDKNDVLLMVQAHVRDGAMARLVELKKNFFKPTVEREHNWKLHCAGYVISSSRPGSTILQCWRLPSADTLGVTMGAMGHSKIYRELVAP
jgi:hypothetical protein